MKYPLVFRDINIQDYERVIEVICESVQLHALIAIHQTLVGPALGEYGHLPILLLMML